MPQKILNGDWSEYDNRKKKSADSRYFSCEELWEKRYLIEKIRKIYPQYSEHAIILAINSCCQEIPPPRPRAAFITCVMKKLQK